MKKYKHKGFTLIELVITLVLVSILSSVAAVVILGPFQTFYAMRDNIKLFAQFDQVSNDLDYYLKQAAPFSVQVADDGLSLYFRRVESYGWLDLSVFSLSSVDTEKTDKIMDERLPPQFNIFFPGHPDVGIQAVVKKGHKLKFVEPGVILNFKANQILRYQVLSGLIQYRFSTEGSRLLRTVGDTPPGSPPDEALVGHLSDCKYRG